MKRENTREGIEAAIADFSVHKLHKMLLTRHRPHWKDADLMFLLSRLRKEVDELEEAIKKGDRKATVLECADVSNFAMMIADNEQHAGTRPWDSHEGR